MVKPTTSGMVIKCLIKAIFDDNLKSSIKHFGKGTIYL